MTRKSRYFSLISAISSPLRKLTPLYNHCTYQHQNRYLDTSIVPNDIFLLFLVIYNFYACFLCRIWYSIGVIALIFHVFCIIQGWWTLNGLPKLNQVTKYHYDEPLGTPCSIMGGYLHWQPPNFCIGIGTNDP